MCSAEKYEGRKEKTLRTVEDFGVQKERERGKNREKKDKIRKKRTDRERPHRKRPSPTEAREKSQENASLT